MVCGGVLEQNLSKYRKAKKHTGYEAVTSIYQHRREIFSLNSVRPKIVMLGDSITQEGAWTELTGCREIANMGISGDTAAGVLERISDVIQAKPLVVLLLVGINDLEAKLDPEVVAKTIDEIALRLSNAGISLFLTAVMTAPASADAAHISALNTAIGKIATRRNLPLIEVPILLADLRDGTHLNASGYAKWRATIAPLIGRFCG